MTPGEAAATLVVETTSRAAIRSVPSQKRNVAITLFIPVPGRKVNHGYHLGNDYGKQETAGTSAGPSVDRDARTAGKVSGLPHA
jgi:hypothetical protein